MSGTFECKDSDGGVIRRKYVFYQTLIKKTLTKILFCSSGPPLTLKVTSTWYVVLSSPWNQKLKDAIGDLLELLSDFELRFTMVVIQYHL